MKKVDVIRPGSLSNIIGPVGTLKRMIKNREYFLSRGYDVKVYTNDDLSEKIQKPINTNKKNTNSKKSFVKKYLTKIKTQLRLKAKGSAILSLFYMKKSHFKVKQLVSFYFKEKRTPDVVVFHSYYECYLFLKQNTNTNIKTVCFFHTEGLPLRMEGIYYPKLIGSKFFKYLLDVQEYIINNVDKCIFISENGRKNFLEYYPNISKDKTSVILNGIEDYTVKEKEALTKVKKQNDFKYNFCCTGTVNTRKGHRIIIDALKILDKEVLSNIHVTFLGEGPERLELEEQVKENNLSLHVNFKGSIENTQVFKYLNEANIYILMSYNEGLPISIIEAMRGGLPIVSTKIAGIPELINTNGILLDPDVNQLVEVFNNIDQYDWSFMGEESRKRFVNEFTFDRMKMEYCNMLDLL